MHEPAETSRERNAAVTRQSILDQARRQFALLGYRATTVKGVADAAGVSPNLITRYFGGKEGLFLAAAQVEIAAEPVFVGELASLGARLAASIVRRWSGQQGEDPLLVLQRAAGERPQAAEALAAFLDTHSMEPLRRYLRDSGMADDEASGRAAAIDAFVLGVSTQTGTAVRTRGRRPVAGMAHDIDPATRRRYMTRGRHPSHHPAAGQGGEASGSADE